MIVNADLIPLTDLLTAQAPLAIQAKPGAQRLAFLPVGPRLLGMSDEMCGVLNLIGRCPERAPSIARKLRQFDELRQLVAASCEYRTRPGKTFIVSSAVHCLDGSFICAAPRTGAVRFRPDPKETRKDRSQ